VGDVFYRWNTIWVMLRLSFYILLHFFSYLVMDAIVGRLTDYVGGDTCYCDLW